MRRQADVDVAALRRTGTPAELVNSPNIRLNSSETQHQSGRGRVWASDRPFLEFLADRLKVQQREAGVRHDLIDAVFALGGEDDLVRLLARVKALQNFVETGDGTNLLVAYKRAANILRKENWAAAVDHAGLAAAGARCPLQHPIKESGSRIKSGMTISSRRKRR